MHGAMHSGSSSLFSLKVVKQFSIVFPLGCFFETKVYKIYILELFSFLDEHYLLPAQGARNLGNLPFEL